MSDNKQPIPTFVIPALLIVALVIIGFSFYAINRLDPGKKSSDLKNQKLTDQMQVGGSFVLKDMNQNEFTEKNLLGKVNLIYFGFTLCPDICPTTLNIVSNALSELNDAQKEQVQALFITIDPSRDDEETLKKYVSSFHQKVLALTGSEEQIAEIAKKYKVYYNKVEPKPEDNHDHYLVDHSSIIYVIGKNGQYLTHFSAKNTPEEISKELIRILE